MEATVMLHDTDFIKSYITFKSVKFIQHFEDDIYRCVLSKGEFWLKCHWRFLGFN